MRSMIRMSTDKSQGTYWLAYAIIGGRVSYEQIAYMVTITIEITKQRTRRVCKL